MRKDSPLAEKECIYAEDLWDKPLILSHQTAISNEMIAWLRKDVSQLNVVATYDLLYNASRFVKMGFGYAIALDKLINTSGDSNLCFRPAVSRFRSGIMYRVEKISSFFQSSGAIYAETSA